MRTRAPPIFEAFIEHLFSLLKCMPSDFFVGDWLTLGTVKIFSETYKNRRAILVAKVF